MHFLPNQWMSLFLDFIECTAVWRPTCLKSANVTFYWLGQILGGCCSSECEFFEISRHSLKTLWLLLGFCIFGGCWLWDVFEVAMNGRSEALPCDRVLWLAAERLQPHTHPPKSHDHTTPTEPASRPSSRPRSRKDCSLIGEAAWLGSRDRFECLLPSKADFYQLMAGGDGGPLAMDVGACPPWASSAVPPAHPDKSTWHPRMSVCSLGYLTENTPGKKTSLRLTERGFEKRKNLWLRWGDDCVRVMGLCRLAGAQLR